MEAWVPGQRLRYVSLPMEGGVMSYSPKPPAKQSRMGVSSQACSRSRRWRCPFPQKGCSTHNGQNTTVHCCGCFPEEYLIPSRSCPSACTGWMQLGMARPDTVVLSVWESISWSVGPLLKQAIYQINSPWNILALRSDSIASINNKVFPKPAEDHKEKTSSISLWQNIPLFGFFSPCT